jgi:hypothetical protein
VINYRQNVISVDVVQPQSRAHHTQRGTPLQRYKVHRSWRFQILLWLKRF